MMRPSLLGTIIYITMVACRPNTTRPPFPPLPEAAGTEVRLSVPDATRHFAESLRADSFPVRKVELRDGYIETPWFNAVTKRPTRGRPTGSKVVRIRAWADPARPGSSQLTVETTYRPLADPSLPERELEQQVGPDHTMALRMVALLQQLVQRYGGAPAPQTEAPGPSEESADSQ